MFASNGCDDGCEWGRVELHEAASVCRIQVQVWQTFADFGATCFMNCGSSR